MKQLTTIDDIISAMGGPSELAELLDVTQQAVSMWKVRGEIPSGWHYRLHLEALRRGCVINPAVFGVVAPLAVAATTFEAAASA